MARTSVPKLSVKTTKWSAAQKQEFVAIRRRATTLSKTLKPSAFDKNGDPVDGPWAKLLADLDAWAARHKIQLRTSETDRGAVASPSGGTAVPFSSSSCPGHTTAKEVHNFENGYRITFTHSCYLRRQTLLGRCVYSCTYEIESGFVTS